MYCRATAFIKFIYESYSSYCHIDNLLVNLILLTSSKVRMRLYGNASVSINVVALCHQNYY